MVHEISFCRAGMQPRFAQRVGTWQVVRMKQALHVASGRKGFRSGFGLPLVVGSVVAVSLWGGGSRVCAPQGTLAGLGALAGPASAMAQDGGMVGSRVPGWELTTVDGKQVKASDFDGKVVLVDFWATWCPPCRKGVPDLIALQKAHGGKGLAVVGISLDNSDSPVKKFIEAQKINYTVVMGNEEVATQFGGIQAIPTAFLIDRSGKIVWQHVGLADKAELEKRIAELL